MILLLIAIKGTFNALKGFVTPGLDASLADDESTIIDDTNRSGIQQSAYAGPSNVVSQPAVGLVYNINIVIPETSDLRVLNAIFRSLRENIMQ